MDIFTYEFTLVSKEGWSKTREVSAENCISAIHKAKAECGEGWEIKDRRLVRVD